MTPAPPPLRDRLLQVGFRRYEDSFASGLQANNKLDLSYEALHPHAELLAEVIQRLGELATEYQPDLIVPVPNGANGIGSNVAMKLNIEAACLIKNTWDTTQGIYYGNGSAQAINEHERIILVEDVINGLTSTRRVMALPGITERLVSVIGIWDRGDPQTRLVLPRGVVLQAIIQEPIAPMLPESSKLWEYALENRRL